jgi:hypothetical protein
MCGGFLFFLLVTWSGPTNLAGSPQLVRTSKGTVEFLGLEKWTPAEIRARLNYASSDELHYCAVDLKKLGFPEVAVVGYSEDGHRYTVVTVVEPEHAAEVVYKPVPRQHIALPPQWQDLVAIPKRPDFLEGGILDYARTLPNALKGIPPLADGTAQPWWPALRGVQSKADLSGALQTLAKSDDPGTRAIAALVLMNFASEDVAWRSLVSGLRDPDGLVQSTCLQTLNSLATFCPRKVDWAPTATDLISLLHGTDLFAFQFVLKALTATRIDPELAGPILGHGGGRLVLAYLRAEHEEQRALARSFLSQMRGGDLGSDPELWEKWIAGL